MQIFPLSRLARRRGGRLARNSLDVGRRRIRGREQAGMWRCAGGRRRRVAFCGGVRHRATRRANQRGIGGFSSRLRGAAYRGKMQLNALRAAKLLSAWLKP